VQETFYGHRRSNDHFSAAVDISATYSNPFSQSAFFPSITSVQAKSTPPAKRQKKTTTITTATQQRNTTPQRTNGINNYFFKAD
jgi:hypothetical protein